MEILFLAVKGAVAGSFLGAISWRWPRGESIAAGRSLCPHCKRVIRWYDNIPLFSYLYLKGRCRDCKAAIPRRDLYMEAGTASVFVFIWLARENILDNLEILAGLPFILAITLILLLASVLITIFVIDLEHQYIPDTLVFIVLAGALTTLIITGNPALFRALAAGLGAATFLLFIHLLTLGKGMGLGDVKLALALGVVLGFPLTVVWMFASFIIGSIVGMVLIFLKLARFSQRIAFGPFLVAGFLVASLFGFDILSSFTKYLF